MRKIVLTITLVVLLFAQYLNFKIDVNRKNLKNQTPFNVKDYQLAWPGILPDNPLYKIKVARNKIIAKMIYDPINLVEFDLLMADKTIYASYLIFNKGNVVLAKDTVLKGEDYYSKLVQDYNKALLQNKNIPEELDRKIDLAVLKHRQIFSDMENKANGEDKKIFQFVNYFSHINYDFITKLRDQRLK